MESKRIISSLVKTSSWYSTKILKTWKNDLDQSVSEFIHSLSTKCYHKTNCISLSNFESCDSLLCFGWFCFLTSNLSKSNTHLFNDLLVCYSVFHTHINNNLNKMWNSHRVFDP